MLTAHVGKAGMRPSCLSSCHPRRQHATTQVLCSPSQVWEPHCSRPGSSVLDACLYAFQIIWILIELKKVNVKTALFLMVYDHVLFVSLSSLRKHNCLLLWKHDVVLQKCLFVALYKPKLAFYKYHIDVNSEVCESWNSIPWVLYLVFRFVHYIIIM